jgi:signal transduction histidine kinase
LLGAAVLVVAGAAWPSSSTAAAVALLALALVIAAVACWSIGSRLLRSVHESRAWAEVALVHAMLAQRESFWSDLPAPAAAWDSEGRPLLATTAWQRLGLPSAAPPTAPEVTLGDPPRVFVVEAVEQPTGARLVVLREVTRERLALQAKDELLAILGHELRTPLSSIKGYGQLMARQLATVQEQVQRLDVLIQDVLDSAQADAGRLTLRREPLVVDEVVRSACERFVAAHPPRSLDIHLRAPALIEGDPARLGQILDNLLSNAAKYSPPDTRIGVQTTLTGAWVRIAVADDGIGIAAEHLPRLFDRFYRVPAEDAAAPPGVGLGLSIVRDLVEAHGGRVEAASDGPGTGCTVTVVLPAALPIAAAEASAAGQYATAAEDTK